MANVRRMWEFFDTVDSLIGELAAGDDRIRGILCTFFFRVLTICDGLEGPDGWNGIALVATEDLPGDVEEINDAFLHDAWSERKAFRGDYESLNDEEA